MHHEEKDGPNSDSVPGSGVFIWIPTYKKKQEDKLYDLIS